MTSIPDVTRMIARIAEWQEGHGKPGGRAEAARQLDEARKLFDEIENMLTDMRRELLGSGRQRDAADRDVPPLSRVLIDGL